MTTDVAIQDTELDFAHLSPLICMELSAGLSTVEGVCEKYNISEEQWLRLQNNEVFVRMKKEADLAFAGDMNAGKRITKKAEILLEESLPVLHRILKSPDSSVSSITDVVKQLTVLAERGPRNTKTEGGVGSNFNVEIQIHSHGERRENVVIQGN